jgi:hypothetical protein
MIRKNMFIKSDIPGDEHLFSVEVIEYRALKTSLVTQENAFSCTGIKLRSVRTKCGSKTKTTKDFVQRYIWYRII